MNKDRRDRMAARLIYAERKYHEGHKLGSYRIVILILAELIGIVYTLSTKLEEESK